MRHWLPDTRPVPDRTRVTFTAVDEPTPVVASVPPAVTQEEPWQASPVSAGAARVTSKGAPLEMTLSGFTTRTSAAPGEAAVRSKVAVRWPASATVAATDC